MIGGYRALAACCVLVLCACGGTAQEGAGSSSSPAEAPAAESGVSLTADEAARAGISVAPAAATRYTPEVEGFALVLSHDAIAQAVADVAIARAAARQSRAAVERSAKLAGTAGADSAEARDAAERQVAADDAALKLAQSKSSSVLGQAPPRRRGDADLFDSLASGHAKLLRVTFPLGALPAGVPRHLRFFQLTAATSDNSMESRVAWDAPADGGMPGRSFFALLEHSGVSEGERLLARATPEAASDVPGVIVPKSALLVIDNAYWFYVERETHHFTRVPIDISRPIPGGYFVTQGVEPGESIVIAGAGLLLARDVGPTGAAD